MCTNIQRFKSRVLLQKGARGGERMGLKFCNHLSQKRRRDAMPRRYSCSLVNHHHCLSSSISGKAYGNTTAESRQPTYSVLGWLYIGFYPGPSHPSQVCCGDSSALLRGCLPSLPFHFEREICLPPWPPHLKYLNLETSIVI